MLRPEGGYVPEVSDELMGPPPTGGSSLSRIECASCAVLRQRIKELEAENERLRGIVRTTLEVLRDDNVKRPDRSNPGTLDTVEGLVTEL